MYDVEKLSRDITHNLKNKLNLDYEKSVVVEYGLYAFFHMMISIILVAVIGAIFNVMIEALIISFTISILRKSSGGAHASSALNCALIGVMVSVIPAMIVTKYILNINYLVLIGLMVFISTSIIIYKLAPVDSPNKPIKKQEKIKRLKKGSIITLLIYMFIVELNIAIYYFNKSNISLVYSLCIYIGIIWQVFTLTKLGHTVVNLMDSFFIKLLSVKGGRESEKVK
ncbi:accessory gene regulator B family protein [Clostridium sp. CTA-7]